jgi:hypothetical protein
MLRQLTKFQLFVFGLLMVRAARARDITGVFKQPHYEVFADLRIDTGLAARIARELQER